MQALHSLLTLPKEMQRLGLATDVLPSTPQKIVENADDCYGHHKLMTISEVVIKWSMVVESDCCICSVGLLEGSGGSTIRHLNQ